MHQASAIAIRDIIENLKVMASPVQVPSGLALITGCICSHLGAASAPQSKSTGSC